MPPKLLWLLQYDTTLKSTSAHNLLRKNPPPKKHIFNFVTVEPIFFLFPSLLPQYLVADTSGLIIRCAFLCHRSEHRIKSLAEGIFEVQLIMKASRLRLRFEEFGQSFSYLSEHRLQQANGNTQIWVCWHLKSSNFLVLCRGPPESLHPSHSFQQSQKRTQNVHG